MPSPRRPAPRGGRPGARGGPGRRPRRTVGPTAHDRLRVGRAGSGPSQPGPTARRPRGAASTSSGAGRAEPRPRLTGRAAVLVLVLAVLAVSYASSLRAYLQQRGEISSLRETISERQDQIGALEAEKRRWDDPEYVRTQARARLGLVMPGETPFVALEDGKPLEADATLDDPADATSATPPPFWDDVWTSVEVAGHPPRRADPPPATLITAQGGG